MITPDIKLMFCRLKAELKKLRKMYEEQIKISREEFMMVHSKKVQKLTKYLLKCYSLPVLRIHDILVCIRIRGSMPLTNGSGSGSFYFHH
jgi:hypothetical protein